MKPRCNSPAGLFKIKRALLDDLHSQQQVERIRKLRCPLLVMQAPLDATVLVDNARQIFKAAMHPESHVLLDDANHLLTREARRSLRCRV